MRRTAVTRVALLEGLPAACLLGVLGVVINYRPLAGAFLAPVGLWTAVGALGARTLLEGVTAPIDSGLSIQWRMKATSSRKRSPLLRSNRRIRLSIFFSNIWKASNGMGRERFETIVTMSHHR